jgi:very-short-patch-repair endonuclease
VESILRQRLSARGHIVEQQVHVPGVGRVDARVDGVLFVEIDGFQFHGDRASFERDRARDVGLALAGGHRLRFSARQVMEGPEAAIATIETVLELMEREEKRGVPST